MAKVSTFGNLKIGEKIHAVDSVWEIINLDPVGKTSIKVTCKNVFTGSMITKTKRVATEVLVA